MISKRSIEGITFAVCLTGDPSDYVTNYLGSSVVNAYRRFFPSRRMIVVATHSAAAASNWFATPNIGQIVAMLPVQMK